MNLVEHYLDWWRLDAKSAFTCTFAAIALLVVAFVVHWSNTAGI